MKKFEVPKMNVQRFDSEAILATSECDIEALGCESCYCSALICGDDYTPPPCECVSQW